MIVCGFGLRFGIFPGEAPFTMTVVPAVIALILMGVDRPRSRSCRPTSGRLDGIARRTGHIGRMAKRRRRALGHPPDQAGAPGEAVEPALQVGRDEQDQAGQPHQDQGDNGRDGGHRQRRLAGEEAGLEPEAEDDHRRGVREVGQDEEADRLVGDLALAIPAWRSAHACRTRPPAPPAAKMRDAASAAIVIR